MEKTVSNSLGRSITMFTSEKYHSLMQMIESDNINAKNVIDLLDFNHLVNGGTAGELQLNEVAHLFYNVSSFTARLITFDNYHKELVCDTQAKGCKCNNKIISIDVYIDEESGFNHAREYDISIPLCDCDYWLIDLL